MAESRGAEREDLTARARRILENAELQITGNKGHTYLATVCVWHYPSFAPWRSWTIFSQKTAAAEKQDMLVRQLTWDAPYDLHRLTDPMAGLREGFHTTPSIALSDVYVPANRLQSLLDTLSTIPLHAVGFEPTLGLDGEGFGYESMAGFNRLRIEWWGNGPAEWRLYTDGVKRLCTEMEHMVADAE